MWSKDWRSIDFNYMSRLEVGLESDMTESVPSVIQGETTVVVVASYRSVSRFKKSSPFQGPVFV